MKIVRVPASSANLGPGFDTLALSLNLHLECRFEPSQALEITVTGRDAEAIPADAGNLIWQTIAAYNPGPLRIHIHNEIPIGKGLGSSAAAITAGLRVANPAWTTEQLINECSQREGHPDNASASVLGGIVASMMDAAGITTAVQIPFPPDLVVSVVVPDYPLSTAKARAALPECYTRPDVVFNLQRTAVLTAALAINNLEAVRAALEDRLHHPYRAPLVEGLTEALAVRAEGLIGCTLSGAGPSILVFHRKGAESCCRQIADLFPNSEVIHSCAPHG